MPCKNGETMEVVPDEPAPGASHAKTVAGLRAFFDRHERITVLSGAGCSTPSGIPEYRDDQGNWKHRRPVQFADFKTQADVRRRYWAQSFAGWTRIRKARPNAAHRVIAGLEHNGRVAGVVTQNVDNLHRLAGSRNVIDLHGILHRVCCLQCGRQTPRQAFQMMLQRLNPGWKVAVRHVRPDGDSALAADDFRNFAVPDCLDCGGILKPDVVFFGEPVPEIRVSRASELIQSSDALLVVGSSLMVFSGFRFVRLAHAAGKFVAILNRGLTRADDIAAQRFTGDCAVLLADSVPVAGA